MYATGFPLRVPVRPCLGSVVMMPYELWRTKPYGCAAKNVKKKNGLRGIVSGGISYK